MDNYIKDKFTLPTGAPEEWRETPSPYKSLNEAVHDHIYLKFDDNFKVYNFDREEIEDRDLKSGEYKAIIKIKGVYYGPHGGLDKLASLQLSIIQLMYKPDFDEDCLFLPPDSPESPPNSLSPPKCISGFFSMLSSNQVMMQRVFHLQGHRHRKVLPVAV